MADLDSEVVVKEIVSNKKALRMFTWKWNSAIKLGRLKKKNHFHKLKDRHQFAFVNVSVIWQVTNFR